MQNIRVPHFLLLALMVLSISGCNQNATVPIEPVFVYDGKPLAVASISFIRSDGEQGRPAMGMTDDSGRAKLTTFKPYDGVIPGNYQVVVIKAPENPMTFEADKHDLTDPNALAKLSSMASSATRPSARRVRSVLPEKYSDPGTTPLKCTVTDSSQELSFELSSK